MGPWQGAVAAFRSLSTFCFHGGQTPPLQCPPCPTPSPSSGRCQSSTSSGFLSSSSEPPPAPAPQLRTVPPRGDGGHQHPQGAVRRHALRADRRSHQQICKAPLNTLLRNFKSSSVILFLYNA